LTPKSTSESKTSELSVGVRKIFEDSLYFRPFIGWGLALIDADLDVQVSGGSISASDNSLGLWFGGGVYWPITQHVNIGFDLRYSTAEVTLSGVNMEAGGGHFGFLLGYHFLKRSCHWGQLTPLAPRTNGFGGGCLTGRTSPLGAKSERKKPKGLLISTGETRPAHSTNIRRDVRIGCTSESGRSQPDGFGRRIDAMAG
jgi:hypothetical protein